MMKLNGIPYLLACLALTSAPALAFSTPSSPLLAGDDDEEEAEEDEDEEDEVRWMAVVGGDVHTGLGGVLRGATVLSKDGVITAVGHNLYIPEDAEVLDVTGLRVYPGLVAVDSSGLLGASGDFADSVDPFSTSMLLGLAGGITSAGQANTALKLKRGEIEGVVMREKYLTTQSYSTRNPSGKRALDEKFASAAAYLREYRQWEEDVKDDKDLKEPSRKGVDPSALSILNGEKLALFNADERGDLLGIARLAQRFGFRPVIEGCREGWTVAGELGRAGAFAIVTPRDRRDKDETLVRDGGSSIENAAILHRSGVQVAVVPGSKGIDLGGIAGRDIMHLPIEAGFAVRGGLSEQTAFEAITIVPARILGVDHRVGTLEVGKDCDLVVTDGDILHYQTFVQYAVVDGKQVYDKQDELFFAHIRPRPEAAIAPEVHVDPGEEAAAAADEPAEDDDGSKEE